MGKNDNLKDYLADLYQGLASVKPDASKNPQDFRSEIESMSSALPLEEKTITITRNTEMSVEPDEGYSGLSKVDITVDVEGGDNGGGAGILITKNVTDNGTYNATDDDADGYSSIVVDVEPDLTTKRITRNGTYSASEDGADGYSSVTVDILESPEITTEAIVVTPNEETQEITPSDADYISMVTVNPIPDEYIIPEGTMDINTNGEYDISDKEKVVVDIPLPEGSLDVTENNTTIDVTQYAEISVLTTQPREISLVATMASILITSHHPIGSVYKYTGETIGDFENNALYKLCVNDEGDRYYEKLFMESEGRIKPMEVATESEMTALLVTAEFGSVYKYTGPTGMYENGALYMVTQKKIATPTIGLDGVILYIYNEDELVSSYDILINGTVKDTVTIDTKLSNLANTTWYIPSGWSVTDTYTNNYDIVGSISRNSSINHFSEFNLVHDPQSIVIKEIEYTSDEQIQLEIYGGRDIADTDLIEWLYTYGELRYDSATPTFAYDLSQLDCYTDTNLIRVVAKADSCIDSEPSSATIPHLWNGVDLTGTTWNIPSGWSVLATIGVYNIIGSVLVYDGERWSYSPSSYTSCTFDLGGAGENAVYLNTIIVRSVLESGLPDTNRIYSNQSFTITFADSATDAFTDTNLIAWLKQNGTLTSHIMTDSIG